VALKSTKSGRVRFVPLAPPTRAAFRKQRAQQATDKLRAGEGYHLDATQPIFTDEVGQRLSPKAATNAFARFAKKGRLSTTSLHRTRHTALTELVHQGVDLRTVAAIAGHSNASVTLSIYSHVVEGSERAAVDMLEGRLERAIRGGTES
jgi:integrase